MCTIGTCVHAHGTMYKYQLAHSRYQQLMNSCHTHANVWWSIVRKSFAIHFFKSSILIEWVVQRLCLLHNPVKSSRRVLSLDYKVANACTPCFPHLHLNSLSRKVFIQIIYHLSSSDMQLHIVIEMRLSCSSWSWGISYSCRMYK